MTLILLKKCRIYDTDSPSHLKRRDILIEKGIIVDIKASIKSTQHMHIIQSANLCVSPGWIDIGCYNGEPGMEHREDLDSLKHAAAHGGYVGVVPFPTSHPTTDTKGQIAYLLAQNNGHLVDIYPVAALTKNKEGQEMAELMDLAHAGAIAFSDGKGSRMSEGQVQRSMLYLKGIESRMIYVVNSKKPGEEGQVHEGNVSVLMGVEGIPMHQEQVAVNTVLRQLAYTDSRVLIQNISLSWAADKIYKIGSRRDVAASVAYFNLSHNDAAVADFDINYKVLPPLRSESDRKKLCRAIEKGKVQVITSNHSPRSIEEKDEPFGLSPFGASSIETTFSSLLTFAKEISLEKIVYCLSQGPRAVLDIPKASIVKESTASFTLFDPSRTWKVSVESLFSKSKNNPYIGKTLQGYVLGVYNNLSLNLND